MEWLKPLRLPQVRQKLEHRPGSEKRTCCGLQKKNSWQTFLPCDPAVTAVLGVILGVISNGGPDFPLLFTFQSFHFHPKMASLIGQSEVVEW